MMIYSSFALLARHVVPWLVLLFVWTGVFLPNIVRKEKSMSRYAEWKKYKANTYMLIPYVF